MNRAAKAARPDDRRDPRPRIVAATMFSGIGAPECSMPSWDWRWCAEVENFPSAVLAARYPGSINLGDVSAEDFVERAEQAGRPSVVVFGSPCQDFSVAGRRVGLDGDRGNLALVALRVVERLRPRWVVFENVPGLLSSRSGSAEAERALRGRAERGDVDVGAFRDAEEDSDFAAFLSLVRECGYLGCYRVTDAQFAGVPQRRRRVFAVFHLGDWRPAAAVLLEPESLRGDHPPGRATGEGVAPTLSARASAGGGLGTDFDLNGGLNESAVEGAGLPVPGVRGGERGDVVADVRVVRPRADDADRSGLTPDGPDGTVSAKWAKGAGGPAGDECYNLVADVAPTLTASGNAGGGNRFPGTNADDAAGGALVVSTLRAGGNRKGVRPPGLAADEDSMLITAFEPRRERGDDGRGYDRGPNFSENVAPALGTVKTPVIAFDCKAGGNTGFAIGDQVGALRGVGHGGGHAAIAFTSKDHGQDAAEDQSPTLRAMQGKHANAGGQVSVVIPILEAGARTGKSTTDPRAGLGDAEAGDPMFTLQAGKQHAVAINLRGREGGAMPETSDVASPRSASGGSRRSFVAVDVRNGTEGDVAQTLQAAGIGDERGGNPNAIPHVFKPSHFTRGKDAGPGDLVPPLSAEADKGDQDPVLMTGTAVRRLTPRECERLQAFPDDHTLVEYRGAPAADGPRYKALGNAMNVKEVGWVLRRIDLFEATVAPTLEES